MYHNNNKTYHHNIKRKILSTKQQIPKSSRIDEDDTTSKLSKEDYCKLYGTFGLLSSNTIGKILG